MASEAKDRREADVALDALVPRLRAGDARAFDALYEALADRVFALLVRLRGSRHAAEDLAQDTWLRVARASTRLAEDTRLVAWVLSIAVNLVRSSARANRVDAARIAGAIEASETLASADDPERALVGSRAAQNLEAAIQSLGDTHREAIVLVAIEGLDPVDAAVALGISYAALRQRLSRGRELLAETLAKRDERMHSPTRNEKQEKRSGA